MINYNSTTKRTSFGALLTLSLVFILGTVFVAQAQTTDATDAGLVKDAGDGVSVKLVDNKGTIKYLQTNNGITSITSTTAGSATTTTWQLGGTLTDNTYIDVDGSAFALDGLALETGSASVNTEAELGGSDHGTTNTGWTLVVRDEATGEFRKLKATNLIQSGSTAYTAVVADESTDPVITATGVSTTASQVWVYRNGAKLLAGTDYTVAANQVTIVSTSFPIYTGDVFEVQWVK